MVTVKADKYLYNIHNRLPEDINLELYDPASGLPDLTSADALLIRTVTPVTRQTLSDIPRRLQFVGTASAGSDHVDIGYLRENGITFCDAAGCNARSVAEYIATVLLLWSEERSLNLAEQTVGIVGAGNVGSELIALLDKLGVSFAAYDPPRAEREQDFKSTTEMDLLSCDIITFHTPLTRSGPYPTWHWMDKQKFERHRFLLLINTARGGVVDETALLRAARRGSVQDYILDVWENEPEIDPETARGAFIKTPHIAGYSVQAKEKATELVATSLLDHFNVPFTRTNKDTKIRPTEQPVTECNTLTELLTAIHPVRKYERALTNILGRDERGRQFNRLRAEFPLREEFGNIILPSICFERFPVLVSLGFASDG